MIGWWSVVGVGVALVAGRAWRLPARPLASAVPPVVPHRPTRASAVRPRHLRRTRSEGKTERAVAAALPDVVDLVHLGVAAGLAPREALERCGGVLPPPFAQAVAVGRRRWSAGEAFAVALEQGLVELGPQARPLLAVLIAGERDGAALANALVRVGDEARRRRRVDAEERARRLPIVMLLPLVLCVLPAFILLALTPVVLASLADLGV